jgi:hypothetical protein
MKGFAGTPLKSIEEVKIWSSMPATQQWKRSSSGTQKYWVTNISGAPYNNRFNLNARGWHVARMRERRASSLKPFCFAGGLSAVLSG